MEITQKQIDAAYAVATPEQKKVLDALFGKEEVKDNRPVTERVKTFDDAVRELGENHPFVNIYDTVVTEHPDAGEDVIAYLQLRIIVAALNEGWEPKFERCEYRWAPWYRLYTKAEMENELDEEERRSCRVVGRSGYNASAVGGLAFADANHASSLSYTSFGSRLAFKSEELAEYAGKQFIDIYAAQMGIELEQEGGEKCQ